MTILQLILLSLSVLAAVVTIGDKVAAKWGKRRVPEQTLFLLAAIGGAAAMYVTMLLIRHKTKHKRFMLGLPLIIAAHCVIYCIW